MELNIRNMPAGYVLPGFDVEVMRVKTAQAPAWLHMGAGNIFRIFVAALQQDLLEAGLADTGIVVYEGYDEEIIPASFAPYDNLTLGVTLHADGRTDKRVIASVAEAFCQDAARLVQLVAQPSLQLISFTITEKGYAVDPGRVCAGPNAAVTTLELAAAGLYARHQAGAPPLALVTMDNFAENGSVLAAAIQTIAQLWVATGKVSRSFLEYIETLAFPWTMIDKITPRPSAVVADMLAQDGVQGMTVTETAKHTWVSGFVNAEACQYLVIEDAFPNGRPPLERAGAYLTDRDTVRKIDQMKVCACLNPLHTILAVSGMLLGYPTIAECMKDPALVALVRQAAAEALPTVAHPGIMEPQQFLEEVLTLRFPNPFIPDAPARIASDTSQKIPVRFGETLKARVKAGLPTDTLEAIPLLAALWLRYRLGTDDAGQPMTLSPDPRVPQAVAALEGLALSAAPAHDLRPILSNAAQWGVDLYAAGLGDKVVGLFARLCQGPGAVAAVLKER